MFGFLKKKDKAEKDYLLHAVADGEAIEITQVNDPVFSQKMMGDGFAVLPTSGDIYAPIKGKVLSVFPTKHAVGMKMDNGLEVLLHMGVDTVSLDGAPFEIQVKEGQSVDEHTLIAKVDLQALKEAEKNNDMIVILTNMDQVASYELSKTGPVTAGEVIGEVTAK